MIPHALMAREIGHGGVTTMHVVDSMHERKALMADQADAFIALPGGVGTFEELFEAITWTQLGLHAKPCGLLNVDGFYDDLLRFLDHAWAEGFIKPETRAIVKASADPIGAARPAGRGRDAGRAALDHPRHGARTPSVPLLEILRAALAGIALAAGLVSQSATPGDDPSVLFVGNSLTQRHDLPGRVRTLAATPACACTCRPSRATEPAWPTIGTPGRCSVRSPPAAGRSSSCSRVRPHAGQPG